MAENVLKERGYS